MESRADTRNSGCQRDRENLMGYTFGESLHKSPRIVNRNMALTLSSESLIQLVSITKQFLKDTITVMFFNLKTHVWQVFYQSLEHGLTFEYVPEDGQDYGFENINVKCIYIYWFEFKWNWIFHVQLHKTGVIRTRRRNNSTNRPIKICKHLFKWKTKNLKGERNGRKYLKEIK